MEHQETKKRRVITLGPQPGPQTQLLSCPAEDILYGGARGGGKSYGMLLHFYMQQEAYDSAVKGLLVRRTYNELEDIISVAMSMYVTSESTSTAVWMEAKKTMVFPTGATLKFRHLDRDSDADKYQGHAYTWICIEEAGNFASPVPINKLRACLRTTAKIPKFFLLTANPGGPGHNWLKADYIDPVPAMKIQIVKKTAKFKGKEIDVSWKRVFIPANVDDNKILMKNDPNYVSNIVASAGGAEWLVKAWLDGDWNIVAGGMFDDVWDPNIHILKPFKVPRTWKVYRSFDWGASAPFSVGYWAVSDGGWVEIDGVFHTFKVNTVIRIGEWYGWSGTPNVGLRLEENEFISQLKEKEFLLKERYDVPRIYSGPADSAIFENASGQSIADEHEKMGINWIKAKKGPGSRVLAWRKIRLMLANAKQHPMEDSGLFVTQDCIQFIRTVPSMQRDKTNLDDIDTNAEDHICDETGYFCRWEKEQVAIVSISGF